MTIAETVADKLTNHDLVYPQQQRIFDAEVRKHRHEMAEEYVGPVGEGVQMFAYLFEDDSEIIEVPDHAHLYLDRTEAIREIRREQAAARRKSIKETIQ